MRSDRISEHDLPVALERGGLVRVCAAAAHTHHGASQTAPGSQFWLARVGPDRGRVQPLRSCGAPSGRQHAAGQDVQLVTDPNS